MEELAQKYGTPLYVYDGDRLVSNLHRLDGALASAFSDYQICFALKANTNPHLLSLMRDSLQTLGADCSSPGELYIADQVGIDKGRRLYTGNYETPEELEDALASAGHLNLDDSSSLDRLLKIGVPEEISFRLNPGFGSGSFPEIVTSGREAKFGIQEKKIAEVYRRAKESGVNRFGIQCMSGSGNLDSDYFVRLLTAILTCARNLENELGFRFSFVSLGGGYGVPYKEGEAPLNVDEMFGKLGAVFSSFYDPSEGPSPQFIIEPGKIVIADSAFLLARVSGKAAQTVVFNVDSGGQLEVSQLDSELVRVHASSGGDLEISGRCSTLDVTASSGADVDLEDLRCQDVGVVASSGADVDVTATTRLQGDASSGGDISVEGQPAQREVRSSSGGNISFDD